MKRTIPTALFFAAAALTLPGAGGAQPGLDHAIVAGESTVVAGGVVSTWARVNDQGKVIWLGLTIPLSMVENMPEPGSGPAGAVAALNFPAIVQQTTYFNHVEIQSNLHGHATNPVYAQPNRYSAPHFDFHFYTLPVANVFAIPPGLFFTPAPAERVPDGWAQPEARSVPQMGRHAGPLSEFTATDTWTATMIAGFLPDASSMHFIEPMITREFLLRRENFTLPVPLPAVLGSATRYPSEFVAQYDRELDAFHFVFKGFEPMP
jgi:hypothetical protein